MGTLDRTNTDNDEFFEDHHAFLEGMVCWNLIWVLEEFSGIVSLHGAIQPKGGAVYRGI